MGALLERHGIGNGKYKVGGSYPNSIFLDDPTRGRGQILMTYTETETSKILQSVEADSEGNFYVGSRAGTNNLFKVSNDGSLVWEVSGVGSINYIRFDPYDELIWVYDATNNNVSSYDLQGNLIVTIPYNVSTFTGLEVSEEYVIIANFGNATTPTRSVSFYNKNGTLVRDLTNLAVRSIKMIGNFLFIADVNRLRKIDLNGSAVWDVAIVNNTVPAVKMDLEIDYDNNIFAYNVGTGTPNPVNFYLINNATGAIIRTATKTSANISPGTNDDFPQTANSYMLGNGKSNPILIARETGPIILTKYINEDFKIVSRRTLNVGDAPLTSRLKGVTMDRNSNLAIVTNKVLNVVDPKEYFKIIE